jgi:hypothetical protein
LRKPTFSLQNTHFLLEQDSSYPVCTSRLSTKIVVVHVDTQIPWIKHVMRGLVVAGRGAVVTGVTPFAPGGCGEEWRPHHHNAEGCLCPHALRHVYAHMPMAFAETTTTSNNAQAKGKLVSRTIASPATKNLGWGGLRHPTPSNVR